MRKEYDFSKGVRGTHAARFREGVQVVVSDEVEKSVEQSRTKVEPSVDDDGDMPREIDFSSATRGRYAGRLAEKIYRVTIRPELFRAFPSEKAVNDALEILVKAGTKATAAGRRLAPEAAAKVKAAAKRTGQSRQAKAS